jgi:hypothetical protein
MKTARPADKFRGIAEADIILLGRAFSQKTGSHFSRKALWQAFAGFSAITGSPFLSARYIE